MYYYSTVNGVVLTHSNIKEKDFSQFVEVYFERARNGGFDFAQGRIPDFSFQKSCGFNEDELLDFTRYLKNNSALIWEFAEKGGGENA